MNCLRCQHANRDTAKFCEECAAPLARTCLHCDAELRPAAKACDECAAPVESPPRSGVQVPERDPRDYTPKHLADKILQSKSALEGERKQVTVLFADVKGSMELAEQLDPEEWHRILDRFFQILTEGVHRFEGTVNQYTGDGIMALFGAPLAHEDHAQRACYAALHIRAGLRTYADQVRLETGLSFAARVGINSGEAVVGRIGDDLRMDYTAQGHTVGLAQRMEQMAEPGSCYVTANTARLVEGYFVLRRLGDARIKGVSEPVGVHELEAVGAIRSRFDASRSRGLSHFVGRVDEMATLDAALDDASHGRGRVMTVIGDAGIGKSRLCFEFAERCRARGVRVIESHAVPHGASRPLLPVLELLRRVFGIVEDDATDVAQRKVAGSLLLLDSALQENVGLMFEVLGVPDPRRPAPDLDARSHERSVRETICRIVECWVGSIPTVLLIEDLHWMDAASEAILGELVRTLGGTSTLFVLNHRPEYLAPWDGDPGLMSETISLSPLGAEDLRRFLEAHVGSDPTTTELRAHIERHTGGNPFYVEEIVRALAEDGVLVGAVGAYRLERVVDEIAVPPTVQATIAGRIDRLGDADKRTLQMAAVIGRRFRVDLLREISELDDDQLDRSLDLLIDRQFIDLEAIYPEREFVFRHALTCDVAYGSPLSEFRVRTHRAVAGAIERREHSRLDAAAGLIAHHLEAADDDLGAARWHARAGRCERRRSAHAAIEHFGKVRRLVRPHVSNDEAASLFVEAGMYELATVAFFGSPRADVRAIFEDAHSVVKRLGDPSAEFGLVINYNLLLTASGAAGESLAALERVAGLTSSLEDGHLRVHALFALAIARMTAGSLVEAGTTMDECVTTIRSLPELIDPVGALAALALGGVVKMFDGRLDEADALLKYADEIQEAYALSYRRHSYRATVAWRRGRFDTALAHARAGVEYAEQRGLPGETAVTYGAMGEALIALGRYREAIEYLERAIACTREHQAVVILLPLHFGRLAVAHLGLGEIDAARTHAEEGVRIALEGQGTLHECNARVGLLCVLAAEEAAEELEAEIGVAAELVDRIEGHRYFDSVLCEARAWLADLRHDDVAWRHEIEEAVRLEAAIGADGHVERLEALVARFASRPTARGSE